MSLLAKFIFILLFLSPCMSYAVDEMSPVPLSQGLAKGLSELKSSTEELATSNQSLAKDNEEFKARLNLLQMSLQKLNQENEALTKTKAKLDEPSPARAKQIEELEKKSKDLDQKIADLNDQMKKAQDLLAQDQKEEQEVNDHINKLLNQPVPVSHDMPAEITDLKAQREKEKLATLKLIAESQDHQKLLQAQLLDFQKSLPLPMVSKDNRREKLEAEAQQLQGEIAQLSTLATNSSTPGWSEEQVQQLETVISDLEKKRDELKDLIAQMQKKTQEIHLTESQKEEQNKLQRNIEKLKNETRDLKYNLEQMQQQMVELDKRKTYLEEILKNQ